MPKKSRSSAGKQASAKSSRQSVKKAPAASKKSVRGPRQLAPVRYPRWQFWRRPPVSERPAKLPNVWRLTKTTIQTFKQHRRVLLGISAIYGVLNLFLVRGLSAGISASSLKTSFEQSVGGQASSFTTGVSTFFSLLGSSSTSADPGAAVYQLFLLLFVSLAVIWALRHILSGNSIRVRQAYYQGMYPLIPFMLVTLVLGLELVPLTIGSLVYATVVTNGIAVGFWEYCFWLAIFGVLAIISIRLIISSLFGMYIVTLPDMTPLKALRSARHLVRRRRLAVLRKLLFLPLLLFVIAAVLLVPTIIVVAPLAQWLLLVLAMVAPLAIHGYLYTLYRELLNE